MFMPVAIIDFISTTLGIGTLSKDRRKMDPGPIVRELKRWRRATKQVLVYHDTNIHQIIEAMIRCLAVPDKLIVTDSGSGSYHPPDIPLDQIRVGMIADINTQPHLASRLPGIISSYPPLLLAELREWQQAVHIIACIDSAISYISTSTDPDPQTERICDIMYTTIATFFPPNSPSMPLLEPAQSRPDDCDRVMDHRVFYDEPPMQDMISLLDEESKEFLAEAADRERERLPLFPAHFKRLWESEEGSFGNDFHGKCKDSKSESDHACETV